MLRLPPSSTLFPSTTLFRSSLGYAQLVQVLPISLFGVAVAAVSLPDLARAAVAAQPNDQLHERDRATTPPPRSGEHTSELQSHLNILLRLLLEKKKRHRISL